MQNKERGSRRYATRNTLHWLSLVLEKMPFFILSAAGCVATLWAQSQVIVPASVLPLAVRLGHILAACLHYLSVTILPRDLAFFYPYPATTPVVEAAVAGIILASISLLALRFGRRQPYLVVGWFWFLGMLVPVIGLVQMGIQAWADRYTYLPLIGLFILAVWGAGDLTRRAPRWRLGFIPLGLALLAGTLRQVGYWRDDTTLFEHALQVTRHNAAAHNYLGLALASQGKTEAALRHLEIALEIDPWRASAQGGIAGILCQRGDFAGALARYRQALQIAPNLAEALNNLAWLLATCPEASLRDGPEAVRLAERACQLTEYHRTAMVGTLAAAYAEAGRFPEAVTHAEMACALAAQAGDQALLARNQQLLELYRNGGAYREPMPATPPPATSAER